MENYLKVPDRQRIAALTGVLCVGPPGIGKRQLNAALHRIAVSQAHYHPAAGEYLDGRRAAGYSTREAIRCLNRRLSDVVYHALRRHLAVNRATPRDVAA